MLNQLHEWNSLVAGRRFQVWEFQISHSHLLVRSPVGPGFQGVGGFATNVDLWFTGVRYSSLAVDLGEISFDHATRSEVESLRGLIGGIDELEQCVAMVSARGRFLVVARWISVTENDWDIFESPIEFRSVFRAQR
jgi:hypothetical protein